MGPLAVVTAPLRVKMRKDIGKIPKKQNMPRNLMTAVVTARIKQGHGRAKEKMSLHLGREKVMVVGWRRTVAPDLRTKGPKKKSERITGKRNTADHIKEMTDQRKAIGMRNLDLNGAQVMNDPEATSIEAGVQPGMITMTGSSMTQRRGAEGQGVEAETEKVEAMEEISLLPTVTNLVLMFCFFNGQCRRERM